MRLRVTLLTASLALAASSARAADPVPSLDLRGFHPPMDPAGLLYLEPAITPGPWNWNVGATASYALRPVVLTDAGGTALARAVSHQASIDYTVNVGLGQTWSAGVSVPTVVYQSGDDVSATLPGASALPHTAIGAIALGVKKTLVTPSDLGGLGISLLGRMYVPTSSTSYVSDRTVSGELRGLGELDLLAIAFRATAGVHVRGATETYVPDPSGRYDFGHDLPWGVGVTFRPQALGWDRGGHVRISAEARGTVALTPTFAARPESPVLAGLSARYTAGEVSAILGAEVPITDAVGNPIVRPVLGVGWAPRFVDEDGDGIEDEDDECPELAEDEDGFEDRDGCPDFDNDDDGVSDDDDKCPKEKEDADDFQDDDGCADPDNDGDGVLDAADACPNEAGPANGPKPGCPDPDPDHDGVLKEKDKCPNEPEDKDGFQDGDGCPDPDNDGDGVLDAVDACPTDKGEASTIPELNGCVIVDHDGDTFDDPVDKCPREPEDFDGVEDEDGCPDAKPGAKPLPPLVTITTSGDARSAKLLVAPRFVKDDVDPKSMPALRALAATLNANPSWIVAVGARPVGHAAAAEQTALNHSFAIALTLRWLTHRDACAETVGWGAVQDLPGAAAAGLGLLVLAPKSEPPAPAPAAPAPAASAPAPAASAPAPAAPAPAPASAPKTP